MTAYVFKISGDIHGVFDNKKDFKNATFYRILDELMGKGGYKTKKQCGNAIKEDLKLFYSEDNYSFISDHINFEKECLVMNKIIKVEEKTINIPKIETQTDSNYIFYSLSDINKPVKLIDVSRYLT